MAKKSAPSASATSVLEEPEATAPESQESAAAPSNGDDRDEAPKTTRNRAFRAIPAAACLEIAKRIKASREAAKLEPVEAAVKICAQYKLGLLSGQSAVLSHEPQFVAERDAENKQVKVNGKVKGTWHGISAETPLGVLVNFAKLYEVSLSDLLEGVFE